MKESFKQKIKNFFKNAFTTDELFWESEVRANLQMAYAMLAGIVVLILAWLLNEFGIFQSGDIRSLVIQGFFESLIPAVICLALKGKKRWLKYIMMVEYIIVLARVDCALSFNVVLLMAIPVVLSCRYYSMHFTAQVAALTALLFGFSAYAGSAWGLGRLDLNFYDPPEGTVLTIETTISDALIANGLDVPLRTSEYMLLYFVPKLMLFTVIAIGCTLIAKHGHNLVLEQANIAGENARIESELTLATDIQANMLPCIFPPFPDRKEFDIYATMDPAKEVGGDFYDFFMVDESHLAIVMADVSGKGVPAALFMVIGKTLIKDHTQLHSDLGDVFRTVNNLLCESNSEGLFITAFEGILDLKTGELSFVNAGHEMPFIYRAGEGYRPEKIKPGFVLAGMEGIKYQAGKIQMNVGDKLFQYTDGVTEATDINNQLYGMERLEAILNTCGTLSPEETLKTVKADVDRFVGEAPQFDDITMLCLEYKKRMEQ